MKRAPGTYAVLLRSDARLDVRIGRRGRLEVAPGYYLYTGSAFGPGGVRARVSRHLRGSGRRHWHIDYLRAVTRPWGVWLSYEPRNQEHRWADIVSRLPGVRAVKGFGCSDCDCFSHLFVMPEEPDADALGRELNGVPIPVSGPWPG